MHLNPFNKLLIWLHIALEHMHIINDDMYEYYGCQLLELFKS